MTAMRSILTAFLALALTAQAEDTRKLVMLKHAQTSRIQNLLKHFGVAISADPQSKAIALSGTQASVEAAEQAIQRLDVPEPPRHQIELTAFVVVASANAADGAAPEPAELAPVIKQLRATFPYKSYRLEDTLLTRTIEDDRVYSKGALGLQSYEFHVVRVTVLENERAPRSIRLDNLTFSIKDYLQVSTSTELREGQKVVIGKATGKDGQAYFLVLTAKVVQ